VGHEISGTTTVFRVAGTVLEVPSVAIGFGKTATVDLTLLSAMDGVSGGRLTVSVDHPGVARINGASYADGFDLTRTPDVSSDGSSVELALADVEKSVQPGATDVPLATLDVEGVGTGTTDLTVEVEAFDDDAGDSIDVLTRDGLVVTGPSALGGGDAPTDPDGDGLYEDVNGNGRLDYDDIVTLFEEFDSDAVRMNEAAYDFNENGELDYDDIVDLYEEI
jgi:PKD repeat protein